MQHLTEEQLISHYYHDGDAAFAEEHLAVCEECRAQFETLRKLLRKELGVEPDKRTRELYEQIRTDSLPRNEDGDFNVPTRGSLSEILARLINLQRFLGSAQKHIQRDIQAVELELRSSKD